MKTKKTSLITIIATLFCLGVLLSSCQPETVKPSDGGQSAQTLNADANDPHPLPNPVCSIFDTIPLISEDGSRYVNYCGSVGTTPIPCPSVTPEWGSIQLLNGDDLMICNFSMALGWFIDISRSSLSTASSFQFDQNGIPIITNDWLPVNVNPIVNKWQLTLQLDSLPRPCFNMGLNLTVVKLRGFFTGIDPNSVTSLWGFNADWNVPNSGSESISPFITPWCPAICPTLTAPDSVCVVAYPNLPGGAGCVTLSPDVSDANGNVSYEWSNSSTSASITVCPSQNTDYTVTVTDNYGPYSVTTYNVNAQNVICTPGNRPTPKVLVCHYPPGNPNNPQTICIDWSGVPAHVEAYRTPNMNPNHGHDSGCHIGPCNSDPCAN
jgi:hypothetical protein